MKDFFMPAIPADKNVFIPVDGKLKEVHIARIEAQDGVLCLFDDAGNFIISENIDTPLVEIFPSYEGYIKGNAYNIRTNANIIGDAQKYIYVKNGEYYAKGYEVSGDVIVKVDKPIDRISFVAINSQWKFAHDGLYISKEEAMWDHDTIEVKADGTAVRHEAEGKKWELDDAQKEIVEGLKALLDKAKECRLELMFQEGELMCASGRNIPRFAVDSTYDLDDEYVRVPDKAIHTITRTGITHLYDGDCLAMPK